jgi:hypothetical protein
MTALNVQKGRQREAIELVTLRKAALVGRMLLGQLHGSFEPLDANELIGLSRSALKKQLHDARHALKGEIEKFCTTNFEGLTREKLAALYGPIQEHHGKFRIPLIDFIRQYGRPRPNVLKDAPFHSTVCISPWGLQTEFPELHLSKDLVEATRQALDCKRELARLEGTNYREAKQQQTEIAAPVSQERFAQRTAIIGSFNLVEAYINGVALDCLSRENLDIKRSDREYLERQAGSTRIREKLTKIPRIAKGVSHGILHETREPLKTFIETVQPF